MAEIRLAEEKDKARLKAIADAKREILKRMTDSGYNLTRIGTNKLILNMKEKKEREQKMILKQRGILKRICDSNIRFMGQGYNKLVDYLKDRNQKIREKLKFILQT